MTVLKQDCMFIYKCVSLLKGFCESSFGFNSLLVQPFLKGVDAVRLANAKLQPDTGTAELKLMDCVFSTSEMVNGNPSGVTRSKDQIRQRTIRPLDAQKMRYIDGMIVLLVVYYI